MGTFRKIVLAIVFVFSIFMLNIDGRYLFGWTEEEWDELEDWANENDIPYNEYSDADDFYADNGYDDEDDYWNSQGYDDADDFWETNDTEGEDDIGDTNTSDPLDAEAVKQEIFSDDATWYKNGDGSFSIDVDNDGMMDYLALVVGSYIYVNDINIEIEEISIIYEPDVSSPNIDQEDSADEDNVYDNESEENGDDDDAPLPIICDCCSEYGHSYCSACKEETVACNCDPCPDCGGCILEYGESLPEGCEHDCTCRTNTFSFKCIHSIIPMREINWTLSTLWTIVNFQFRFITMDWSTIIERFRLDFEYIRVETSYLQGTLSHWSGDIKYNYDDQIIDEISNESISSDYTAHLTNDAYVMFYGINDKKEEKLLYRNYATIEGLYIPSEIIDRDGIPKKGEPIEKVYLHKPVWIFSDLL